MSTQQRKKVVLGVTGSIAAYKAAEIIRRLQDASYDVVVIMTQAAQQFITPLTLETLSRNKVAVDMFDTATRAWQDDHISFAQSADVLLIAPASANVLAKLAYGLADDILTCTALATRAPIVVAPAMNTGMYTHEVTIENCQKLKKRGIVFVEPIKGKLACGDEGLGHLAEVSAIIDSVKAILK